MSSAATRQSENADTIQTFIEIQRTQIVYGKSSKAVFYLGNTGAGKTTTTQLIHGKLQDLESIEPELSEFLIQDIHDKISSADTITSKTFIPDLLESIGEDVTYYDCPGFNDNRSPSHDIAASYFIKKFWI